MLYLDFFVIIFPLKEGYLQLSINECIVCPMLTTEADCKTANGIAEEILKSPTEAEDAIVTALRSNVEMSGEAVRNHLSACLNPLALDRMRVFTALRGLVPVKPKVHEAADLDMNAVRLWYASVDYSHPAYPVVRGRVDPRTLSNVRFDTYQREHLASRKKIEGMRTGFKAKSKFPDLDFANRGVQWNVIHNESLEDRGLVIEMVGNTWCVDGRQRVSNAISYKLDEQDDPILGASVMFNSTEPLERDLFEILNQDHTQVASQVMLRNRITENGGVKLVHDLTSDAAFPLQNRVCWKQNSGKSDLMTGTSLAKTICWLHEEREHIATKTTRDVVASLGRLHDRMGGEVFRNNILELFNFIDRTWGLRRVPERPKPKPAQVMSSFTPTLARLFAQRGQSWQDFSFRPDPQMAHKMTEFPMDDPYVRLASNSGTSPKLELQETMLQHIAG